MRTRRGANRGLHPAALLFVGLLVVSAGGGGTVGLLAALGYIDFNPKPPAPKRAEPDYKGMVKVPIARRPAEAYTQVTREDLSDPDGRVHFVAVNAADVNPEWMLDVGQILGRVLARDKTKGLVFTEADFLPKGTRPGIVAGIPSGKRAMVVGADKVQGLHLLRRGDRFDLLATVPLDMARLVPRVQWGLLSNDLEGRETAVGNLQKQASVRVLVQSGALVNHGSEGRDATIAVEPAEITPLTEAMALGVAIFCVARSGRPDDPGERSMTPEHDPLRNVAFVENIRGRRRDLDVFITSSPGVVRGTGATTPTPLDSTIPPTPDDQADPAERAAPAPAESLEQVPPSEGRPAASPGDPFDPPTTPAQNSPSSGAPHARGSSPGAAPRNVPQTNGPALDRASPGASTPNASTQDGS